MKLILMALLAAALSGCTQSERARLGTKTGDTPADVTCRNYGNVVYQGRSTGKVIYDEGQRVTFVDAASGRLTTVGGECVIVYARAAPAAK